MHHFVTEICTFLLQSGALWDMGAVFMKIIRHVGHFPWLEPNVWWEISQILIEYIKPIRQMSDEPWKFFAATLWELVRCGIYENAVVPLLLMPTGVFHYNWWSTQMGFVKSHFHTYKQHTSFCCVPDSKVHGANIGPTWALSAQMGPMLAPWTLLSGVVCVRN